MNPRVVAEVISSCAMLGGVVWVAVVGSASVAGAMVWWEAVRQRYFERDVDPPETLGVLRKFGVLEIRARAEPLP